MTIVQKIIKYAAIAFGTYLTVIIITIAVAILGGMLALSGLDNYYGNSKIEKSLLDSQYSDDDYYNYDYNYYEDSKYNL